MDMQLAANAVLSLLQQCVGSQPVPVCAKQLNGLLPC